MKINGHGARPASADWILPLVAWICVGAIATKKNQGKFQLFDSLSGGFSDAPEPGLLIRPVCEGCHKQPSLVFLHTVAKSGVICLA